MRVVTFVRALAVRLRLVPDCASAGKQQNWIFAAEMGKASGATGLQAPFLGRQYFTTVCRLVTAHFCWGFLHPFFSRSLGCEQNA